MANFSSAPSKPPYSRRVLISPPPPYQIEYSSTASGKHIHGTKRHVRWKFGFANPEALMSGLVGADCRGEEHEVVLIWSVASGKRHVYLDGQEIHHSSKKRGPSSLKSTPVAAPIAAGVAVALSDGRFDFTFDMQGGRHTVHVVAKTSAAAVKAAGKAASQLNCVVGGGSGGAGKRRYDLFLDGLSFFDFPRIYQLRRGLTTTEVPTRTHRKGAAGKASRSAAVFADDDLSVRYNSLESRQFYFRSQPPPMPQVPPPTRISFPWREDEESVLGAGPTLPCNTDFRSPSPPTWDEQREYDRAYAQGLSSGGGVRGEVDSTSRGERHGSRAASLPAQRPTLGNRVHSGPAPRQTHRPPPPGRSSSSSSLMSGSGLTASCYDRQRQRRGDFQKEVDTADLLHLERTYESIMQEQRRRQHEIGVPELNEGGTEGRAGAMTKERASDAPVGIERFGLDSFQELHRAFGAGHVSPPLVPEGDIFIGEPTVVFEGKRSAAGRKGIPDLNVGQRQNLGGDSARAAPTFSLAAPAQHDDAYRSVTEHIMNKYNEPCKWKWQTRRGVGYADENIDQDDELDEVDDVGLATKKLVDLDNIISSGERKANSRLRKNHRRQIQRWTKTSSASKVSGLQPSLNDMLARRPNHKHGSSSKGVMRDSFFQHASSKPNSRLHSAQSTGLAGFVEQPHRFYEQNATATATSTAVGAGGLYLGVVGGYPRRMSH